MAAPDEAPAAPTDATGWRQRLRLLRIGLAALYGDETTEWSYDGEQQQEEQTEAVLQQLQRLQIDGMSRGAAWQRRHQSRLLWRRDLSTRVVRNFGEVEYPLRDVDKIFASMWVSQSDVLVGTKCNKLMMLQPDTRRLYDIPLIAEEDTGPWRGNAEPGQSDGSTPETSIVAEPFAHRLRDISDLPNTTAARLRPTPLTPGPQGGGIHSIAVNPSRTLLATGGARPNLIGLYKFPSFEPVALLLGHVDWIFSLVWIDDNTLISASRDRTISSWPIADVLEEWSSTRPPLLVRSAKMTVSTGYGKPRALVHQLGEPDLFELSTDAMLKQWDLETLRCTRAMFLRKHETVAAAIDHVSPLIACGSQSHIVLVDPRREAAAVHSALSMDDGWGVRSISFHKNAPLITVGGGMGRLSFFDLRTLRYVPQDDSHVDEALVLKTGSGWLKRDLMFHTYFQQFPVRNTVYTHCYDPAGTRLFAAGGPLQLGLCGSYAALWQ